MPTESIIDEIGELAGWDAASKLALALEYIENQKDDAAWRDFLQEQADAEKEV